MKNPTKEQVEEYTGRGNDRNSFSLDRVKRQLSEQDEIIARAKKRKEELATEYMAIMIAISIESK